MNKFDEGSWNDAIALCKKIVNINNRLTHELKKEIMTIMDNHMIRHKSKTETIDGVLTINPTTLKYNIKIKNN